MKVYWSQAGLNIQPESDVETEALMVLLDCVRYERPPDTEGRHVQPKIDPKKLGQVERGLDLDL